MLFIYTGQELELKREETVRTYLKTYLVLFKQFKLCFELYHVSYSQACQIPVYHLLITLFYLFTKPVDCRKVEIPERQYTSVLQ